MYLISIYLIDGIITMINITDILEGKIESSGIYLSNTIYLINLLSNTIYLLSMYLSLYVSTGYLSRFVITQESVLDGNSLSIHLSIYLTCLSIYVSIGNTGIICMAITSANGVIGIYISIYLILYLYIYI
jgi:hypothetical protein